MDVRVWTIKKAECWKIDAFELWCWRRLLRVPLTAKRPIQSILKEISPEYYCKDWCWSSNTLATWRKQLTCWKRPWCWERLRAGGEGDNRGWDGWMDHWLNGHEFEQTLGDGEEQGSLACCSPWGCKESDTTEWLNNNNITSHLSQWGHFLPGVHPGNGSLTAQYSDTSCVAS